MNNEFHEPVAEEKPRPTLNDQINALPDWARQHIHDIETKCDPAGDIRTITELRDTIRCLTAGETQVGAPQPCAECNLPDNVIAHHPGSEATEFKSGSFYHPFVARAEVGAQPPADAREPHDGWMNTWLYKNIPRDQNCAYLWNPEVRKMAGDWADFRVSNLRASSPAPADWDIVLNGRACDSGDPCACDNICRVHHLVGDIRELLKRTPSATASSRKVEFKREANGRWIAEIVDMPGVMAYGETPHNALNKALEMATAWGSAHRRRSTRGNG